MIDLKERDRTLARQIVGLGAPDTLAQCFRCGACSGICPVEKVVEEFDPRVVVHCLLLGLTERLFSGKMIWYCSECGSCLPVCPMEVKPMEVIKALKAWAKEKDPQALEKRYSVGRLAKVDPEKCIACLTCVRTCPFGAPSIVSDGYAVIDPEKCQACGICVVECPARAIYLEPSPEMSALEAGV